MTSARQFEANRTNALKSTGPRTVEGKARSRNALTHGLSAQDIVIPGESVTDYQLFEQGLIDDLQPNGPCEHDLIKRFVATCWRLRRIPRFEALLMAWLENRAFYEDAQFSSGQPAKKIANEKTAARWLGRESHELEVWGRVVNKGLNGTAPLLKLNAYEARLLRQSQQLLGQFFALRKTRTPELVLGATTEKSARGDDKTSRSSEIVGGRGHGLAEKPPQ